MALYSFIAKHQPITALENLLRTSGCFLIGRNCQNLNVVTEPVTHRPADGLNLGGEVPASLLRFRARKSFPFLEGSGFGFSTALSTRFANVDAGPEEFFLAGIAPLKRKRNAQKEFFHWCVFGDRITRDRPPVGKDPRSGSDVSRARQVLCDRPGDVPARLPTTPQVGPRGCDRNRKALKPMNSNHRSIGVGQYQIQEHRRHIFARWQTWLRRADGDDSAALELESYRTHHRQWAARCDTTAQEVT